MTALRSDAKWPTQLNPCEKLKHYRTADYGVQGYVTKLCIDCVYEKKAELGEKALETFNPDLTGATCK